MWKICSFKGYGSIQTSKMVRDYKFLFQSELSSGLDWPKPLQPDYINESSSLFVKKNKNESNSLNPCRLVG